MLRCLRFVPPLVALRASPYTPPLRPALLVFMTLFGHKLHSLLASPFNCLCRPFGPSAEWVLRGLFFIFFPARFPFTYYALCWLLCCDQVASRLPQSRFRDTSQISQGKFFSLQRTTAEFTLCVLDGYGLRYPWLARPTLTPASGFCSSARAFAPRFLQTPSRDDALALR